ncbi:MAG: thymidine phosphorylase, partial [Candidatus Diapherotrites archaeon]|nr:thymidine phosphorylase [Candidatus Diapherotrites archaeon]
MDQYVQRMKAKYFKIKAGKFISILHEKDAKELGVNPLDRIEICNPKTKKKVVSVVDITVDWLKENEIGLFEDIVDTLGIDHKPVILEVKALSRPESVNLIKKKMAGKVLTAEELQQIVSDLGENKLSEIEASAFMTAVYIHGFNLDEIVAMTQALVGKNKRLQFKNKKWTVDKHSIGGINGRATLLTVAILASAGLQMPKTSSRSITSAAGTADAMEVLANVSLSLKEMQKVVLKTGGCIVWGGSLDLAPVDDKIIKIEHPLALDPEGQVVASVMAKKYGAGAKYLVIDIPVGPSMKISTKEKGERMAKTFIEVG